MPKKEEVAMPEKEQVMLVFGKAGPNLMETKGIMPKPIESAAVALDDLLKYFSAFKVDSIELSIEGSIKSGGITNLIVSAEGKGGMKVVLKPK